MNPGLNTRFWTRKDVDRSKAFMFAIQKRLKTRRIFHNLESFVGGRVREGDYRLLKLLKDALRQLKGKALVDDDVTSHSIDPEMLNVDVEPLNPRLLNNRSAHSDYFKITQEEAAILGK
nr:hypothetical protein [Tanacetum cinerariifolium]